MTQVSDETWPPPGDPYRAADQAIMHEVMMPNGLPDLWTRRLASEHMLHAAAIAQVATLACHYLQSDAPTAPGDIEALRMALQSAHAHALRAVAIEDQRAAAEFGARAA